MAVIGSIRKRVGLLIGFVGVSMILFILGDLVTSNKGLMAGNSDVVGEIGGEKIHYQEFERRFNTLVENYKNNTRQDNVDANTQDMLREQAWTMFVNDMTVGKQISAAGISCSSAELYELCTGKNPHPQIKQAFTDPKTGQFDPTGVVRFLKDLPNRDEKIQRQWKSFEDAIREERLATKYKDLVKMGLFTNSVEAKRGFEENQRSASIRFVRLDYNTIPDSTVKVDDGDLSSYYNANSNKYKQAENVRKVEYITFDVNPSDADRAEVEKWINEKKADFTTTDNAGNFVTMYSDAPFDSSFKGRGQINPAADTLFNAPIGTVVGPIMDGNTYKLFRSVSSKMVADSVKARHILLTIENGDTAKAMSLADSLKNAIKKGSSFAELAGKFSKDPGSGMKGGDLGWFRSGMMVKPFEDASFNGNKGDMPIVVSQFGVHLIEVQEKGAATRQIQIATVERKLEPSQKTYDAMFNKANAFRTNVTTGEEFDAAIIKQGLNKRIADNIRENDKNIPGLDQPREMVRWAYTGKKGELSKVFSFGDKYVIAHLVDIRDKGTLPLDAVKDQVTAEVRKMKKADMLMEKFKNAGGSNIDAVAAKLNTAATDADNITMGNTYIPGLGNEAYVVGSVFAMKAGQLSKPIKGESGVIVVAVKTITEPAAGQDAGVFANTLNEQRRSRSEYEIANALKEKANIEDNRGKFY